MITEGNVNSALVGKVHQDPSVETRAFKVKVGRWKAIAVTILVISTLLLILAHFSAFLHGNADLRRSADDPFGDLIFVEEFDTLNLSRWSHEISLSGFGNWEFEYYVNNRSNSYVRDGVLYIKPTLTNNTFTAPNFLTSGTIDLWATCTNNMDYGCMRAGTPDNVLNSVQSARMNTKDSFAFKYGRIEVRAQMPQGDWLWPAIWLLPQQNGYGQWPASGEIDLIESRGNDRLTSGNDEIGANQAATTLHWGPYYGGDQYLMTTAPVTLPNDGLFSEGFHNWTMDWTPEGFKASLDGEEFFNTATGDGYWSKGDFDTALPGSYNPWQYGEKDAPFDQEFYFVLNVAAGGTNGYFPDNSMSQPRGFGQYTQPWGNPTPTAFKDFWNAAHSWYPTWHPFENNGEGAAMKVDYIRVYEYKP